MGTWRRGEKPMNQPRIEGQQPAERGESGGRPVVRVRRASEIAAALIEWLWRDRVPLGMLTLFSGDPKP